MFEMSNISKIGKSACSDIDLTKPTKNFTKPKEAVAGPEISPKCIEMHNFEKVMGSE